VLIIATLASQSQIQSIAEAYSEQNKGAQDFLLSNFAKIVTASSSKVTVDLCQKELLDGDKGEPNTGEDPSLDDMKKMHAEDEAKALAQKTTPPAAGAKTS
jgi:hypothetical protein